MVNNIIDLVNCKTHQGALWTDLMHRREQSTPDSFHAAIQLIDNYTLINRIRNTTTLMQPYSHLFEDTTPASPVARTIRSKRSISGRHKSRSKSPLRLEEYQPLPKFASIGPDPVSAEG